MVTLSEVVGGSSIATVVYTSIAIGLFIGIVGTLLAIWIIKKIKSRKPKLQKQEIRKDGFDFPQQQQYTQPQHPQQFREQFREQPQQYMPPQFQQRPTPAPRQQTLSQYDIDRDLQEVERQQQMEMNRPQMRQQPIYPQEQMDMGQQPPRPQPRRKDDFDDFLKGY